MASAQPRAVQSRAPCTASLPMAPALTGQQLPFAHNSVWCVPARLNRLLKKKMKARLLPAQPAQLAALPPLRRSQYPDSVWTKVAGLFPWRGLHPPLAIDVAVGSEGRAGVELAKR